LPILVAVFVRDDDFDTLTASVMEERLRCLQAAVTSARDRAPNDAILGEGVNFITSDVHTFRGSELGGPEGLNF
jgi:hypothetical protein